MTAVILEDLGRPLLAPRIAIVVDRIGMIAVADVGPE
jgi:hypothetical protein